MLSLRHLLSYGSFFIPLAISAYFSFHFFIPPLITVLAHELGHFFVGHALGGEFDLPIAIFIPPIILGLTHYKKIKHLPIVAYAGPIFGITTSFILTAVSAIYFPGPLFISSLTSFAFEIFALFYSKDATTASKWLKDK